VFNLDPSVIVEGASTYRISSWDRTGGNNDFAFLVPGSTTTLMEATGPGKVVQFYWATAFAGKFHFRQLILRAYWDGEAEASIECPIGDLFCIPHCKVVPIKSLGAVVNPGGNGFITFGANLYLPMPFATAAKITITYEPIPDHPADPIFFWYHINLERHDRPPAENVGRLHAQWRRENLTKSVDDSQKNAQLWAGLNTDGLENYVALEAEGMGQMVGLHLQIDNVAGGWYGEGDDMIFIDGKPGDQWPPAVHGTGSEEVFGGGACPDTSYAGPYTGFHLIENPDWSGKNAMYRWYLADPVRFAKSIVWSVEHGHANNFENDYTSVAYWYQKEPHATFPALPEVKARIPRYPDIVWRVDAGRAQGALRLVEMVTNGASPGVVHDVMMESHPIRIAIEAGKYEEALKLMDLQ